MEVQGLIRNEAFDIIISPCRHNPKQYSTNPEIKRKTVSCEQNRTNAEKKTAASEQNSTDPVTKKAASHQ